MQALSRFLFLIPILLSAACATTVIRRSVPSYTYICPNEHDRGFNGCQVVQSKDPPYTIHPLDGWEIDALPKMPE